MKKHILISLLICFIFSIWIGSSTPLLAGEELTSSSAVLIDATSGQILYGKSPYTLYSSGDFDKLLNVITALKAEKTTDSLTVSEAALAVYNKSPNLGLTAGETVSLLDMIYAQYLEGHNDAANVVAENIGRLYLDTGSADYVAMTKAEKTQAAIDAYARLMNDTADELCASTMKATNADGHYYDTQQCSSLDVARLIRNGLKTDSFKELFTTEKYSFTIIAPKTETTTDNTTGSNATNDSTAENSTNNTANDSSTASDNATTNNTTEDTKDAAGGGKITLNSSNSLFNGSILYAGVKGGITAYNSSAEKYHCAVYAVKDDIKLIAVVMNGTQSGVYDDVQALLNLGFYKWKTATVSKSTLSSLLPDDISSKNLAFTGDFDFLLPVGYGADDLEAAVAYTENGYLSGTITLSLPADASYAGTVTTVSFYEKDEPSIWEPILKVGTIFLLILGAVAVIYILYRIFSTGNKAYNRRVRLTAQKEKYLKHIKDQTSSLYRETNKLKPHGKTGHPESRNTKGKTTGRPGQKHRTDPHKQHHSQPSIRHKDTK